MKAYLQITLIIGEENRVDPTRTDDLQTVLDEFAQLMERYLGAVVHAKQILARESPEMVLVP